MMMMMMMNILNTTSSPRQLAAAQSGLHGLIRGGRRSLEGPTDARTERKQIFRPKMCLCPKSIDVLHEIFVKL